MTDREMEMYDMTVEMGIATAEELNLVRHACSGTWADIIDLVYSIRTECNSFDEYMADMAEEE